MFRFIDKGKGVIPLIILPITMLIFMNCIKLTTSFEHLNKIDRFALMVQPVKYQADNDEFPYLVTIYYYLPKKYRFNFICAGTIISEKLVLTTRDCYEAIPPKSEILVKTGRLELYSEDEDYVQKVHALEMIPVLEGVDLAILKLKESLRLDDVTAAAVTLPHKFNNVLPKYAYVAGWAKDYKEDLQVTNVKMLNFKECNEEYNIDLTPDYFCGYQPYKSPICHIDAGQPVVIKKDNQDVLIGVASKMADSCGDNGALTLFVRIAPIVYDIENIIYNEIKV